MKTRLSQPIAVLLLALLAACASATATPAVPTPPPTRELPTATAAPVDINACYSTTSGGFITTWYAYEKDLFHKYGLNVNLSSISSGTTTVTALLAGDVDICQLGPSAAINAVVAGQDVLLVAGIYNVYPGLLMVTPDIHSLEDLRGKALGINQPGSSSDTGTRLLLERIGLAPDRDVAILPVGNDSDRLAAMLAGQIAGTLLVAPYTSLARQQGFVELYDMSTIGIPYAYSAIVTTRSFLSTDRPSVENYLKAIFEAMVEMKTDPEGTKAVFAKYLLLDPVADAAALDDAYQQLILTSLAWPPYPSMEGIQTLLDVLKASNPDAALVRPEQAVDLSILEDPEMSAFIADLGK